MKALSRFSVDIRVLIGLNIFLLAVFIALLVRGLDLGFTVDSLDYVYHFERYGFKEGMRWLLTEHLQRHLAFPVFPAVVEQLFPEQSAPWYAHSWLTHFANATMIYVLINTILRGQLRWISVAAALLFVFHVPQMLLYYEFPTVGGANVSLGLSLLSLWLYLQYVRRGRRNHWWREWSLAAFILALAIYEQTVLFFLLHPLIAYFEDREQGNLIAPLPWLVRAVKDSFWFPVSIVAYLYLIWVLFPSQNLAISPLRILQQFWSGLVVLFSPARWLEQIARINDQWLLTLILALVGGVLLWVIMRRETAEKHHDQTSRIHWYYLVALGFGMIVTNILSVSPTTWDIAFHPRLIFASASGFGIVIVGVLYLLLSGVSARWRNNLILLVVVLLVGSGIGVMFVNQDQFKAQNETHQRVLRAMKAAIPGFKDESPPYILLVSDVHIDDLWLFARDVRFPYTFERVFGVYDMMADAIYYDADPALMPADDQPGAKYNGPFIVVEPEGIYSPLGELGVPIDPERLVIVEYDSVTQTAQVLDELPAEALAGSNIIDRVGLTWQTNYDLVAD